MAKAKPNATDVAMPSTTARIVFELFKAQTQAPFFGVPYKGSATAVTKVISGPLPLIIDTVTALRPQVVSGKLKAIAVTSLKGTNLLPGVKPVAEQGLPGFEVIAWNALSAPKGTPKEVIQRLNAELNKSSNSRRRASACSPSASTPAAVRPSSSPSSTAEQREWGPLISAAGSGRSKVTSPGRPTYSQRAPGPASSAGEPPTRPRRAAAASGQRGAGRPIPAARG